VLSNKLNQVSRNKFSLTVVPLRVPTQWSMAVTCLGSTRRNQLSSRNLGSLREAYLSPILQEVSHFILNAQYIGALLKEDGKEGLKPINLDSVIGEGDRIENN
jgi:hypothetical protein